MMIEAAMNRTKIGVASCLSFNYGFEWSPSGDGSRLHVWIAPDARTGGMVNQEGIFDVVMVGEWESLEFIAALQDLLNGLIAGVGEPFELYYERS